jgi:putative endonuclease
MNEWSVYMLRDASQSLYVGVTTDVDRRLQEHKAGGLRGAKYTRSRKDLELVYACEIGSRSLASQVEYRLKRWPKSRKEELVRTQLERALLLDQMDLADRD